MSPVELFITEQPVKLKPVLKKLRALIFSASPFVEEKLVYNIPFFYGKKRIFYLNPQGNRVDLGFCEGYLLSNHPVLQTKNRSQVRTIGFYNIDEIEEDVLLPIIHEAIIIDEIKNRKVK